MREDPAIEANIPNPKLTREGICRAFNLPSQLMEALEKAGVLTAGEDETFDLTDVAAALFTYGMGRARAADEKLAAVANALNETLPALQRLATLPDNAALEGDARERVTVELSTFFNAFSSLLAKATEVLRADG